MDPETVRDTYDRAYYQAYDQLSPDEEFAGDCPTQTGDPVPMVTNEDVLVTLRGQLPRPEPVIAPGRALTGLQMYLETERPLSFDETITAQAAGQQVSLEVRATGTYDVDWGDGERTGPYDEPGDPYPDGQVTHVFEDAEHVSVSVIDTWTIQWRFSGAAWSQPFEAELNPRTLDGFEVEEIQAVRTGGS